MKESHTSWRHFSSWFLLSLLILRAFLRLWVNIFYPNILIWNFDEYMDASSHNRIHETVKPRNYLLVSWWLQLNTQQPVSSETPFGDCEDKSRSRSDYDSAKLSCFIEGHSGYATFVADYNVWWRHLRMITFIIPWRRKKKFFKG